ncbi:PREDICTED: NHL repeat-containing protein 2-like [Branchiostoma belcheri]|uniref:NHL repeat-containing protein 2-like n=1 Tax=Branchiostoma belcheri TaxID=7741 RepID=A0A6P4ZNC3_BRABE|nr:PREDICTED: NHL repeat-containing protein 2-like [Branchiostoma belcheri]XP_019638259.1 PREDICTED: NHL repeat-containing protein 2-like [Branchiostoma belcheri]
MEPSSVVRMLAGLYILSLVCQAHGLTPGEVSIIAGGGKPHEGDRDACVDTAASMDGFFLDARFNYPWGLVFDKSDNSIYVADCGCPDTPHSNDRIRRIYLSDSWVTTIAGSSQGNQDGVGKDAHFHHTAGMVVDEDKAMLYVCDSANNVIRQVSIKTGEVKTFAGNPDPEEVEFKEGKGLDAKFYHPQGLYLDTKQNRMFVADTDNHVIREMSMPDAVVRTVAGAPKKKGLVNGRGSAARFYHPTQMAYDPYTDILYVTDHYNHAIRSIKLQGYDVGILAGSLKGEPGFKDGKGTDARLNNPEGIAFDTTHRVLYVAEFENNCIRMITPAGIVKTLAGGPTAGYKDGTGAGARFFHPTGLTLDPTNKVIYVTDQYNHLVRSVTAVGHNYDGPAEMVYVEQNRPGRQASRWQNSQAAVMMVMGVAVFLLLATARAVARKFCIKRSY